jgi:serine/threonine protein phosphatase 1
LFAADPLLRCGAFEVAALDIHYAIGDVHGRDDLLEQMLERILAQHRLKHGHANATIVYLGDYIDRGAKSVQVIDRAMRGVGGFTSVYLKGNHEQLMLDCLDTDDVYVWANWIGNGGIETMASLGLGEEDEGDPIALAKALGSARLQWLDALKLTYQAGPYLFVHAGIVPGRPLAEQKEKDLLWIRDHFLDSEEDHGFIVVHGHTPSFDPELKRNRINVDTGATFYGQLTAVVLGEAEGPRFTTVEGLPGAGP